MRKIVILCILVCCLFLSGCWRYSSGKSIGFVTTVEGGIFWDYVWLRAELESSQTDPYLIRKGSDRLKKELLETSRKKQRIEIEYIKHVCCAGACGDEVTGFEIVD